LTVILLSCVDLTPSEDDDDEAHMRQISVEDVARFRSNSSPEHSNDSTGASENYATESDCQNGCQTPRDACISTISGGGGGGGARFSPACSSVGSSLTLSCTSSGAGETASGSGSSTPPERDLMTSSAGALRETAIMGDSSDDRLTTDNNNDISVGSSVVRQPPTAGRNLRRLSQSTADLPLRDIARCLDRAPETDILHAESASNVVRATPEVETYLRLPPATSQCGGRNPPTWPLCSRDVARFDSLPADMAAEAGQTDVANYPELSSTSDATTSVGCRWSSADVINRIVADPLPSSVRRLSDDRRAEVRRRVTSPLDRKSATAALSDSEARRAAALAHWAKIREHFRPYRTGVAADPRLRLLEIRRSRSSDRQGKKRLKTASRRGRRRCVSAGSQSARLRRPRAAADPDNAAAASGSNNLSFRAPSHARPRPSTPVPIRSDADLSVGGGGGGGGAMPYDFEPLSFDDAAAGAFSYTDDPFDYDEAAGHDGGKVTVPITICLVIIAGYIFAGAVLFTLWEDWDYLTGSYFCFITLSTIGFGDIVPGTDMDKWASSEKLVLCALWLAFGLSLLAMCFNLMQEEVKEKCKWIGLRLGILRDDEPQ